MTDAWDGRPENPEQDGTAHWLRISPPASEAVDVTALWEGGAWSLSVGWGEEIIPEKMVLLPVAYIGPCLTPAEVEARIAEARREGIEAAAEAARRYPEENGACKHTSAGMLAAILRMMDGRSDER